VIQYLLDTNTLIYTINNRPAAVREQFEKNQEEMGISTVSLMELYFGAEKSQQLQRNLKDIEGMAARLTVLDYDISAARHTGEIRSNLKSIGNEIGPYDAMIAGHARSRGFVLVTNNEKEFSRVDGLRITNWVEKK